MVRLTKADIGRRVTVKWRDPFDWKEQEFTSHPIGSEKGRECAPLWTTEGMIVDLTDGWVKLLQNACVNATQEQEGVMVHVALIEEVIAWSLNPQPMSGDAVSPADSSAPSTGIVE